MIIGYSQKAIRRSNFSSYLPSFVGTLFSRDATRPAHKPGLQPAIRVPPCGDLPFLFCCVLVPVCETRLILVSLFHLGASGRGGDISHSRALNGIAQVKPTRSKQPTSEAMFCATTFRRNVMSLWLFKEGKKSFSKAGVRGLGRRKKTEG